MHKIPIWHANKPIKSIIHVPKQQIMDAFGTLIIENENKKIFEIDYPRGKPRGII